MIEDDDADELSEAARFPFGFQLHFGDEFNGLYQRFEALIDVGSRRADL